MTFLLYINKYSAKDIRNHETKSILTIVFDIGLSIIKAPIPTPINGLVILEPIKTPRLISFDFFLIPSIAVVSSGKPVAIPIIKTPIKLCYIPMDLDK